MWDKQVTTYRSLKCKKTELELSQNETEKQFKGFKGKIYAQEEEERFVKVFVKCWSNIL